MPKTDVNIHIIQGFVKEGSVKFLTMPSGSNMLAFQVETERSYTAKDGEEKTSKMSHRCVLWGKRAEWEKENVFDGAYLRVVGDERRNSYDAKDGTKVWYTEIQIMSLEAAGGNAAASTPTPAVQAATDAAQTLLNEI